MDKLKRKKADLQDPRGASALKKSRTEPPANISNIFRKTTNDDSDKPKACQASPQMKISPFLSQQLPMEDDDEDGEKFCYHCQMPFKLKVPYRSKSTHKIMCLETNFKWLPPCPDGLKCDSRDRRHYARHSHFELKNLRAGMPPEVQKSNSNDSKKSGESIASSAFAMLRNVERESDAKKVESEPRKNVIPSDDSDSETDVFAHVAKYLQPQGPSPSEQSGSKKASSNWSELSQIFAKAEHSTPKESVANQQKCPDVVSRRPSNGGRFTGNTIYPFGLEPVQSGSGLQRENKNKTASSGSGDLSMPSTSTRGSSVGSMPSSVGTISLAAASELLNENNDKPIDATTDSNPMEIKAVEGSSGSLHIEVNVKPHEKLDKLVMVIPHPNGLRYNKQVIDVSSRFRAQTSIESFFKPTAGAGNSASTKSHYLTNGEKLEAAKKGPTTKQPFLNRPPTHPKADQPANRSSYQAATCPFYKKIANTSFAVDAFNYGYVAGISKYFLSHFHYDHYRGLSKHWTGFQIYCSPITSRLLQLKLRVDPKWIKPLEMNETYIIDQSIELTLLDANHCPGSVMFLFRHLPTGKTTLHCGDFRASPEMEEYPALWNSAISRVYLDTTYCQPAYDFPSQSDVVSRTIVITKDHLVSHPKTLICVGSYTIGKERIFMALSEALDCKIFAATEKAKVLKTIQDSIIDRRLTSVPASARIHVVEMGKIRNRGWMKDYVSKFSDALYDKVLAIVPTGWTHQSGQTSNSGLQHLKIKPNGTDLFYLEVPYSEHSSFSELKRFVQFLKLSSADDIIATVNVGNPESRDAMKKLFRDWVASSKKR